MFTVVYMRETIKSKLCSIYYRRIKAYQLNNYNNRCQHQTIERSKVCFPHCGAGVQTMGRESAILCDTQVTRIVLYYFVSMQIEREH